MHSFNVPFKITCLCKWFWATGTFLVPNHLMDLFLMCVQIALLWEGRRTLSTHMFLDLLMNTLFVCNVVCSLSKGSAAFFTNMNLDFVMNTFWMPFEIATVIWPIWTLFTPKLLTHLRHDNITFTHGLSNINWTLSQLLQFEPIHSWPAVVTIS